MLYISEILVNNTEKSIKLIASGDGAMQEKGLQTFIFNFLNWEVKEVSKYDGGSSKLYFENLTPLFFVEQRAGWSQIQARQITRYGIRDVKKVAFEYLFGLDKFNIHLKEIELKELQEQRRKIENTLENKETNIFVISNGNKTDTNNLMIEKSGIGNILISDLIKHLSNEFREKELSLKDLSEKKEQADEFEKDRKEELKIITHRKRKTSDRLNTLKNEINSYQNYLEKIKLNKYKNQQLKKLNQQTFDLNITHCPMCQQSLDQHEEGHCNLCGKKLKKISTPDENLAFLEDEKASFDKILNLKQLELRKMQMKFEDIKNKEKELTEHLDYQIETYFGKDLQIYREKIKEIDRIYEEKLKYERILKRWKDLDEYRKEVIRIKGLEEGLSAQIKKYKETNFDKKVLRLIMKYFQSNIDTLNLFKA